MKLLGFFLRFELCKQRRVKTTAQNPSKSSSLVSSCHVEVQRTSYLPIKKPTPGADFFRERGRSPTCLVVVGSSNIDKV